MYQRPLKCLSFLTQHSTKTKAITKYEHEERLSWGDDNSFFFVVVVGFLYFHFLINNEQV